MLSVAVGNDAAVSYTDRPALPDPIRSWTKVAHVAARVVLQGKGLRAWQRDLGSSLAAVHALEPVVWSAMGERDRLTTLQHIEDAMAAGQSRKPALVIGGSSRGTHGQYSPNANVISLSSRSLAARHPRRAVQTLIHEDRHALQAAASRGLMSDQLQARRLDVPKSWIRNDRHYHNTASPVRYLAVECASLLAEVASRSLMRVLVPVFALITLGTVAAIAVDLSMYRFQPFERDANAIGSVVAKAMYPRAWSVRKLANVTSTRFAAAVAAVGQSQIDAHLG